MNTIFASKKDKEGKGLNIALLASDPTTDANQAIIAAAEKRGHTTTSYIPKNMHILISDKEQGYDGLYYSEGSDEPKRINAKDIDAVIVRIGESQLGMGAAILEQWTGNLNKFCTQTAAGILAASDKLKTMQRLSQAKIKTPRTIIGGNPIHGKFMIEKIGGLSAIAKTLNGSQGKGVYPLIDPKQTNVFLENFQHRGESLLLQSFIDGDCKDIRAIVIDGKVIAAMERTAPKGEIRANLSRGGTGKKIDLSEKDQEMCVKAANACGLKCAGVDLMKDKEGVSYFIEVNSYYGGKVAEITGVDIATPLIEFVERNYKQGGSYSFGMYGQINQDLNLALDKIESAKKTIRSSKTSIGFLYSTERVLTDVIAKNSFLHINDSLLC